MDLPIIHSQLYKNHEHIIGRIVEKVAKESCAEAASLERSLVIKNVEKLKQLL